MLTLRIFNIFFWYMIFAKKKHEIETESEKSFVEIKPVSDVTRVEI